MIDPATALIAAIESSIKVANTPLFSTANLRRQTGHLFIVEAGL